MFTAFVNLVFLLHIPIGVLFVSINSVIYNYIPSCLTISLQFSYSFRNVGPMFPIFLFELWKQGNLKKPGRNEEH